MVLAAVSKTVYLAAIISQIFLVLHLVNEIICHLFLVWDGDVVLTVNLVFHLHFEKQFFLLLLVELAVVLIKRVLVGLFVCLGVVIEYVLI